MLKEHDFFKSPDDMYAIYQLKPGEEYHLLRFAGLSELQGQAVDKEHYQLVYAVTLDGSASMDTMSLLEELYMKFNLQRPDDFAGHSMSVSDVVVLRRDEEVRSYYTDSFGFEQLPDFFPEDNPLRTAEMGLEDDYNMIDGMINNGPRQEKEQLPVPDLKPDEPRHRQHKHRSEPER